nr:MAG TPA: zinc-ribbon protein [Caudoviricetes sp.]
MKIIKQGTNLDRKPSPVRFTCRACGCVFELDWEELKGWPSHQP